MDLEGKIFENKVGLKYKVIKFLRKQKTERYYLIQFIESGSLKEAEKRNIKKGAVRDDYHKHIYNVACKGNIVCKKGTLEQKAFKRWYSMIERCYNKEASSYKSYGAKGVYVCEKWHCFECFYNDLPKIKGYDEKLYKEGKLQLDKDLLFENNKEYSLEKCCFVSETKNKSNQPTKKKQFIAISPSNKIYEFDNQSECARQFNLTARTIGKVLNKQLNQHKGWKFFYK